MDLLQAEHQNFGWNRDRVDNMQQCSVLLVYVVSHLHLLLYTVFRKKTPTHIFFHISMNYLWI